MFYLFCGPNQDKARGKWRQVIKTFGQKYPTGQIFQFTADDFDSARFEELIVGQDLFGEKRLVASDRLLESEIALAFVAEKIVALVASPTVFIFLEIAPPAALVKKIEAAGGKIEIHEASIRGLARPFNIFLLCEALAARDRERLWILCQTALRAGFSAEDIFWKFVWQIKTLLLVKNSSRPLATMKPFVWQKSQRALQNFKAGELEKLSGDLVALWHDSRRGLKDFAVGLERLTLSV